MSAAKAQNLITISGKISDQENKAALPGASVSLKNGLNKGAVANENGFYSIRIPAGKHILVAQYIGYGSQEREISATADLTVDFTLKPVSLEVKEVEVTTKRKNENIRSTQAGEVILPMEQLKTLPVLFGETDILKTIQLLPGVKSAGEGNTGFYVRGGGADQNLVLLNESVIYNPGHLFNFFSVFNSDALQSSTLIKGNMPARFGGRLSSVLDITSQFGNNDSLQASGGLGLIASRLMVSGPIVKEKATYFISGRRTYIDLLSKPFLTNSDQQGVPYYFYDLNAGFKYVVNQRNRLFFSGYYGQDAGSLSLNSGEFEADFNWGNAAFTTRWNHIFNDRLFLNTSVIYSGYKFRFSSRYDNYTSQLLTKVNDYTLKSDLDWQPDSRHTLQFGWSYTRHLLTPRSGSAKTEDGLSFSTDRVKTKYGHEAAIYLSENWGITDAIEITGGLRLSFFRQEGPFTFYNFTDKGSISDSVVYAKGRKVKDFITPEPRIYGRFALNSRSSIKAGFSQNAQYLHLVSNSFTSLPLDVWVPSSVLAPPQKSTHYSAGYFRNFKENMFEASIEIYYKKLLSQLEYREGYSPGPRNQDLEYEFVSGTGEAYGLEFFLTKNAGDLQGWVGYTLSKAERTFPALNKGTTFPAKFDRRHDLSLVASYALNKNWNLGGTFVYGTGQPITMPERRYVIEGTVMYQYGGRNNFRMEAYHRLDLSATYQRTLVKKLKSSWTFSVYNVYARKNPFFYYIDNEGSPYNNTLKVQAKKVSVLPLPVPSVTWNFKF